jgi:hypothetical protein
MASRAQKQPISGLVFAPRMAFLWFCTAQLVYRCAEAKKPQTTQDESRPIEPRAPLFLAPGIGFLNNQVIKDLWVGGRNPHENQGKIGVFCRLNDGQVVMGPGRESLFFLALLVGAWVGRASFF